MSQSELREKILTEKEKKKKFEKFSPEKELVS